jgi:hypothetical protein
MSERAAALARRVEDDPFFLASALAAYARAQEWSEEQLAARLGCTPAQLTAVRLCRKPRGSAKEFQQDVQRIAERFQIDSMVIVEAVRLADALHALRPMPQESGFLIAARDRGMDHEDEAADETNEP